MKTIIIITAFLFFISCKETKKPIVVNTEIVGKTWKIKLENNLGFFKIILPKHFDTLFNWTQYSDCGDGCAKIDYRIQSKLLPVFKDNGFYWIPLDDSVEQFTIKHPKLTVQWPINDTSLVRQFSGKLKNEFFRNSSDKFLIDTILKVDKLNIAVIAFNTIDPLKNVKVKILNAMTAIDGNLIELCFEYRKSYKDSSASNFIQTSFDALKTVRVSKGR